MSMHGVFQSEDVLAVKSVNKSTGKPGEYAVLSKCPGKCAARLRLSEKEFVYDHAMFLAQRFGRGSCRGNLDWPDFGTVQPPETLETTNTEIG
jgi:hypothetical protein